MTHIIFKFTKCQNTINRLLTNVYLHVTITLLLHIIEKKNY